MDRTSSKVTPATVKAFVKKQGNVTVVDLNGTIRILQSEAPDLPDLVANANRFNFRGHWYTRAGFSRLLESLD